MKNKITAGLVIIMANIVQATPGHVLFAEARNGTPQEIQLVATVMNNRIGDSNFGNFKTLEGVVNQKKAFSCIGDPKNLNWKNWDKLSSSEKKKWEMLSRKIDIRYDNIVMYHDKSISNPPKNWVSSCFKVKLEVETEHFKFYSLQLNPDYVVAKSNKGWKPKVNQSFSYKINKSVASYKSKKKR